VSPVKDFLRDLRDSSKGIAPALREREQFRSIEAYCGFLGHGRSGHSLIGALVNAHRNAVISHELNTLRYLRLHLPRNVLYGLIVERDRWFVNRGARWWGYSYEVPGQWQGRWETLRVIGDKKGGQTTSLLTTQPQYLRRLRNTVRVPLRFIWVIRNPYDNIATKYLRPVQRPLERWTELYFRNLATAEHLVGHELDATEVLVFRIEDFIASPRRGLEEICGFLGLPAEADYLEACASVVVPHVSRSRERVEWPTAVRDRIEEGIAQSSYLSGYEFEEQREHR
jgi:Sulfotransferase family